MIAAILAASMNANRNTGPIEIFNLTGFAIAFGSVAVVYVILYIATNGFEKTW